MNNLSSYCGLVDAKIRASDKVLPVQPGLAALAITYALNINGSMVWMVRMACDLENSCVALERILEYSKLTPEASWEQEKNEKGKMVPKVKSF